MIVGERLLLLGAFTEEPKENCYEGEAEGDTNGTADDEREVGFRRIHRGETLCGGCGRGLDDGCYDQCNNASRGSRQ